METNFKREKALYEERRRKAAQEFAKLHYLEDSVEDRMAQAL